jgi:RES domain-containing protein
MLLQSLASWSQIDVPDDIKLLQLEVNDLPNNWNAFPHLRSSQSLGDQVVREGACCLLRLPSVVIKGDYNVLINPHHVDFKRIQVVGIEAFPFDQRIFVSL